MVNRYQKAAVGTGAIGFFIFEIVAVAAGRVLAVEGMAIGVVAAIWSVGCLGLLVYALMRDRPDPKSGFKRTLLTAVLKLPITVLMLYVGATLPQPGLGCFLAGIGLVYCCTVWFLVGASRE